jgi:hypothetical protein
MQATPNQCFISNSHRINLLANHSPRNPLNPNRLLLNVSLSIFYL